MVTQKSMGELPKMEQAKRAMSWWNNLGPQQKSDLKNNHALNGVDKIRHYWLKNIVR